MAKVADPTPDKKQEGPEESVVQPEAVTQPEVQAAAPTDAAGTEGAPPVLTPSSPGRKVTLVVLLMVVLAIGAVVLGIISGRNARLAKMGQPVADVTPTPPLAEEDALTASYAEMSDSDEVSAIEADLQATSFEGIDSELSDIDQELSSSE